MPLRVLIVTGSPWASRTAAERIASKRSVFHGSADPPPRLVTLGTGQPKFRSM